MKVCFLAKFEKPGKEKLESSDLAPETGLAQCAELNGQNSVDLAENSQPKDAKLTLQHTGNVGLDGAVVVPSYRLEFPQHTARSVQTVTTSPVSPNDFKSKVIFDEIKSELKKNGAEYVKKINGIFCFRLKKGHHEGVWIVDVKNGHGSVKFDPAGKGEVTVSMTDEDFLQVMVGDLPPQMALIQGKLKINGNIALVIKLQQLVPEDIKSKL